MTDRLSLRLSAVLLFAGELVSLLAGFFHPSRENPNDHRAVFVEYAANAPWTVIHFGQFVGMVGIIAGLLVLCVALNVQSGTLRWVSRLGAVSAVVTLALHGVLQAIDGVALKQAVDAWVRAPDAEKGARFASAEAMRWLEWAIRSYQSFMLGLSLVLLAAAVVGTAQIPRPIGYLMGLSGLSYIVQGFVLGTEGFSGTNTAPQLLAYVFVFVWSIWLLIVARRMTESV